MIESRCQNCGGLLRQINVKIDIWVGEHLVVIEDVPARVCENCGERFFSKDSSIIIDNLLSMRVEPKRMMMVPVLSYTQVAEARD